MKRIGLASCALFLALAVSGPSWAAVIANYSGEFSGTVMANGWRYLWNAPADWNTTTYTCTDCTTGAIGTSATYQPMVTTGSMWTVDGDTVYEGTGEQPGAYDQLYKSGTTGGHPGRGSGQAAGVGNNKDRYAIAEYTVQSGESGFLQIIGSSILVPSTAGSVDLRVYINDTLVRSFVRSGGVTSDFNMLLGSVNVGDRVYVAVGPNGSDNSDSFNVNFQLDTYSDATARLWDPDGAGSGRGGAGTWNTSSAPSPLTTWDDTTGTFVAWNNSGNLNAYFNGTGGAITVAEPITARSMTFATDGYSLSGSAITMTGAGLGGPAAAAIEVSSPGTTATIGAVVTGTAGLRKTGAGTLTLNNFNTYTGGTTVDAGTLLLGTGGATGAVVGTLTVNPGATVNYTAANAFGWNGGASVNVLNIVGGTVGGADLGNHFWNSFQLNMTGGTLYLGGTLNEFHSPTITVNSSSTTAQILRVTGNAVLRLRDNTSALVNVADGSQAVDLLINVPITQNGTSGITKIGAGAMTLSGATITLGSMTVADGTVNFTGSPTVTLSGGILVSDVYSTGAATNAVLNIDSGSVTVGNIVMGNSPGAAAVGTINQSGGTVRTTGSSAENDGVRLGHFPAGNSTYNLSGGTLILDNGTDLDIGCDGTGLFNQTGGEAFATRVVVNKRTGGAGNGTFTVSGGTFNVGSGGIVNDSGPYAVNVGGSGGTIKASATFTSALNMTLSGTGANAATFHTNGNAITLSGALSGSGGLNKSGAGTLTLSGVNTYTGATTVDGGTLLVTGSGQVYPGTPQANVGTFTINSGGTLQVTGGGQIYKNLSDNKSGALTVNSGGTLVIENWALSSTASLGYLYFAAGNIVVNGGTIRTIGTSNATDNNGGGRTFTIGAAGATLESANAGQTWSIVKYNSPDSYPLVSNGGTLTLTGIGNGLIAKDIPGTGGLIKSGAGTWTLTGGNTYTGGTTVNEGTLNLGYLSGGTGTIRGTLTVNAGATVNYTAANPFGYTAGQSVNVLNIVGGTVGGADLGNHFWNSFQLNMTGGTLYLGGTLNEWHNPTITVNSASSTAQILAVTGNAVMRLRDGTSAVFNVADGSQTVDLLVNVPITFHTGTSGITKNGAGTMALTQSNTYNGTTAINGGRLLVNNTAGSGTGTGPVLVSANGTLGGTGSIGGPVTVDGILAPGTSPGTLTIDNTLVLNGAAVLDYELAAPNQGDSPLSDRVDVLGTSGANGDLTLDGVLNVTALSGFGAPTTGDQWRLFNYTGTLTDNVLELGTLPALGPSLFYVVDTATYGQVNLLVGVPEPATAVLFVLGAVGLAMIGRRRRTRGC
jgi:fibronectin-binding autotransporter adhesin